MRGRLVWATALALMLAAMMSAPLLAHEGHAHKVMGVVMASGPTQMELKTPSGEVLAIAVTDKTVVTRFKQKMQLADVQRGLRAVVDIGNGADPLIARGIRLGVMEPGY
jgi:hypothetical protein